MIEHARHPTMQALAFQNVSAYKKCDIERDAEERENMRVTCRKRANRPAERKSDDNLNPYPSAVSYCGCGVVLKVPDRMMRRKDSQSA